jgi:hypothetical protein
LLTRTSLVATVSKLDCTLQFPPPGEAGYFSNQPPFTS